MASGPIYGPPLPLVHDPAYPECRSLNATEGWWARHGHVIGRRRADVTCWDCATRTNRERYKRAASIRQRPRLPAHTPGTCRLCATPLTGRRTSWCSDSCADLWFAASASQPMLAHLVGLHGWACWSCGSDEAFGRLDVDHVRPLWSLTEEERVEPRWWLPFNLQLLCVACHKEKTAYEAGARARGVWVPWVRVVQPTLV